MMTKRYKNISFLIFFMIQSFVLFSCSFFDSEKKDVIITVGSTEITLDQLKNEIQNRSVELGIKDKDLKDMIDFLIRDIIDEYLIIEYARENNIEITEKELNDGIARIAGQYSKTQLREELLSRLKDTVQWRESIRRKLLIEKVVKMVSRRVPPPTYKEVKEYYYSHLDQFRHPEMVRFRQIVARSKDEAEMMRDKLLSTGSEEISKQSAFTTEKVDTQMGWIKKGHAG